MTQDEAQQQSVVVEEEDTQREKYLTFSIDDEYFGIEIRYVTEIIGVQTITQIPEMPEYIRGIINLRGNIIPVMDVRLRFKKAFREYDDRTCVIVIEIDQTSIGLIVDKVSEVLTISDDNIVPPPELKQRSSYSYIKGIGKTGESGEEVKLILDCDLLLHEEDKELVAEISS